MYSICFEYCICCEYSKCCRYSICYSNSVFCGYPVLCGYRTYTVCLFLFCHYFLHATSLIEIMDTYNFIDGRFHSRNSGVKGFRIYSLTNRCVAAITCYMGSICSSTLHRLVSIFKGTLLVPTRIHFKLELFCKCKVSFGGQRRLIRLSGCAK